ncbi:hypothetical protein [Martelella sp.]|uniref:hypothetical protein n=1 Tax=Martelella sp. TaxID=1969699 RepID=UPI0025C31228|nr:hypothetical protein [Martelella sp.]
MRSNCHPLCRSFECPPKSSLFALLVRSVVNDIFPRDALTGRSWNLARFIMQRPRYTRWATHDILSRHWKKALAEDFGFHMAHQMLANVASKSLVPDPELLKSRNPFRAGFRSDHDGE